MILHVNVRAGGVLNSMIDDRERILAYRDRLPSSTECRGSSIKIDPRKITALSTNKIGRGFMRGSLGLELYCRSNQSYISILLPNMKQTAGLQGIFYGNRYVRSRIAER